MKNIQRRYLSLLLLLAAGMFSAARLFFRELWCDEAITVMSFVESPGVFGAYWNYAIANNHILYSLLLKLWVYFSSLSGSLSDLSYRIPSLFFASGLLVWMFIAWRRLLGNNCALVLSLALALTPAFAIYATAVRGYMLGLLLLFGVFEFARKYYFRGGAFRASGYFIFSLGSVAVMPSNLLIIALMIFFTVFFRGFKKRFSWPKVLVLCTLPVLAFIGFYLPLWPQLLKNAVKTTGWPSSLNALLCVYGAFFVCFIPLLAFFSRCWKIKTDYLVAVTGVLIFPALIILLRHPAPFPRVFFPVWLIGLLIIGIAARKRLQQKNIFKYTLMAVLCWGICMQNFSPFFSKLLVRGGSLDDHFSPYYVRHDFRPYQTLAKIKSVYKDIAPQATVNIYSSFGSDPYSLLFYSRYIPCAGRFNIYFDSWRGRIQNIVPGSILVTRKGELAAVKQRFSLKDTVVLSEDNYQKIYRLKN